MCSTNLSVNKVFKTDTAGVKDSFWVDCADVSLLPPVFQGYIMVYQREEPGSIVLLDVEILYGLTTGKRWF
jgi:hypothetical protein